MNPEHVSPPRLSVAFSIMLGVLLSVCGAVPAAILTAMFYRFPVIMAGYVSIPELLGSKGFLETAYRSPILFLGVAFTAFILGIRGWYIFLAVVGGVGGCIVHRSGVTGYRETIRWNLLIAFVSGMIFAIFNASLENQ
jgi:hypothetical protein